VTSFKKGDRVFTFVKVPGTDKSTGAFQQYTIGNANLSSKIPENLSFEEAATIPLAAVTAIVGIYSDLKISPPWTGASYHGEPFLVWGGASSVGMLAVQFAKLSGFKVITTASSRNYELVKSLGADIVIDYNDSQVVEKIRQASNGKLKYVFDAVVSNGSTELAAEALGVDHGEIVTVLRVDQAKFSNATIYPTFAGLIHNNDNPTVHELGKQFWAHLEDYLKNGKVKPNPQKILSGGLLAIPEGFKLHKAGKISGEKLVYQVKQTPGL
jgi:NADPH:quinone reductase-like Zn-dependent oxidoreductase